MILYHGTYPENIEGMLDCGYIDNTKAYETTLEVDDLIEKHLGKKLTHNATYLGDDLNVSRFNFECVIPLKVGVDLDRSKLFVANCDLRTEIYDYPEGDEELPSALDNYINSFVSFDEYVDGDVDYYDNPEYLYFDKIHLDDYLEDILMSETGMYEDEDEDEDEDDDDEYWDDKEEC